MGWVVNGQGTARPNGSSPGVGLNDAAVDDFDVMVLMAETDMGVISDGGGSFDLVFRDTYTVDGTALDVAVYFRISDGSTGSQTFNIDNSQRVAVLRVALTGDSGQAAAGPEETLDTGLADSMMVAKSPEFPDGDSLVVQLGERNFVDPVGLGTSMTEGDDDTSSVIIVNIRCNNYHVGICLLPEGDDPYQVGWAGGI